MQDTVQSSLFGLFSLFWHPNDRISSFHLPFSFSFFFFLFIFNFFFVRASDEHIDCATSNRIFRLVWLECFSNQLKSTPFAPGQRDDGALIVIYDRRNRCRWVCARPLSLRRDVCVRFTARHTSKATRFANAKSLLCVRIFVLYFDYFGFLFWLSHVLDSDLMGRLTLGFVTLSVSVRQAIWQRASESRFAANIEIWTEKPKQTI